MGNSGSRIEARRFALELAGDNFNCTCPSDLVDQARVIEAYLLEDEQASPVTQGKQSFAGTLTVDGAPMGVRSLVVELPHVERPRPAPREEEAKLREKIPGLKAALKLDIMLLDAIGIRCEVQTRDMGSPAEVSFVGALPPGAPAKYLEEAKTSVTRKFLALWLLKGTVEIGYGNDGPEFRWAFPEAA